MAQGHCDAADMPYCQRHKTNSAFCPTWEHCCNLPTTQKTVLYTTIYIQSTLIFLFCHAHLQKHYSFPGKSWPFPKCISLVKLSNKKRCSHRYCPCKNKKYYAFTTRKRTSATPRRALCMASKIRQTTSQFVVFRPLKFLNGLNTCFSLSLLQWKALPKKFSAVSVLPFRIFSVFTKLYFSPSLFRNATTGAFYFYTISICYKKNTTLVHMARFLLLPKSTR